MIVSHEKKDIIRSHHDVEKDSCRFSKKAVRVSGLSLLPLSLVSAFPFYSSTRVWPNVLPKTVMRLISTLVRWIRLGFMR